MPSHAAAFSFDVEDWFHSEFVPESQRRASADSVVERGTSRILDLLRQTSSRATFFLLGDVVREHPALVRRIADEGHEIGCHGVDHRPLWRLDAGSFARQLDEFRGVVERVLGHFPVVGYRAPSFSLDRTTAWALDVLREQRYAYDSSIFPARVKLYGVPDAPVGIYRPARDDLVRHDPAGALVEFPVAVGAAGPVRLPVAGGFYLRALPFAFTAMPEDADKALALLARAVELEPDYAAAHAMIAWCHEQRYLRGGLDERVKQAALYHARTAIAAGSDDAAALATAAFVIAVVEYDYETATTAFDRSFALSSSSALALGFSSIVRAWKGDDAIAVDQAERAIRLSPLDPLLYVPYIGLAYAHFAAGRFEEAAAAAGRASQSNPKFSMPYVLHAAALANLGRREEARMVADRLRQVEPALTVSTAIRSARFANPDKNAELGDAIRLAGLPD